MAKINDVWHTLGTPMNTHGTPVQLQPELLEQWTSNTTFNLGKGIYSEAQLRQHRLFTTTMASRSAVVTKQTFEILKNSGVTMDTRTVVIDTQTMTKEGIKAIIRNGFFPLCELLGDGWNVFVNLLIVLTILKTTIDVLLRLLWTHHQEGCSLTLLYAVWDSIWIIVKSPIALTDAATRNLTGKRPETKMHEELNPHQNKTARNHLTYQLTKLRNKFRGKDMEYGDEEMGTITEQPYRDEDSISTVTTETTLTMPAAILKKENVKSHKQLQKLINKWKKEKAAKNKNKPKREDGRMTDTTDDTPSAPRPDDQD